MSEIPIRDFRELERVEAIRRAKRRLDEGAGEPLALRLTERLALVGVRSMLEKRSWLARKYQAGGDILLLGSPPDDPPLSVWYGPGGWKVLRGDDETALSAPSPMWRLMSAAAEAGRAAAPEGSGPTAAPQPDPARRTAIIVGGDSMGYGQGELGARLMMTYFDTLTAMAEPPELMFFYNAGARLTTLDSAILPALHDLALQGTDILTCSICLEHLGLGDQLKVGRKSNMYELLNIQGSFGRVIHV